MGAPPVSPPTFSSALFDGVATATRPVLVDGDATVDHVELTDRIERRRAELALTERSLVVLAGDNSIEWVVTYLALLNDGHVPLLTATRHAADLADVWRADTSVTVGSNDLDVTRHASASHDLHTDLALLMSTSGSTGSPKLVRLSHRNLLANARSIIDYQRLDRHDRGVTSLPLHYCFGLSVLHSHLLAGASVAVTDSSVVDPCFRSLLHDRTVTNVAGVPHTYQMLEAADPGSIAAPSLRMLTQAGGRLAPDAVARWRDRARSWDADFLVMYGQTEATARMAYLPPELADRHPEAIGVPVAGGSFEIRPHDDEQRARGIGELVYRGDNVMMGYAMDPGDLGRGHDLDELTTGDLARFHADDGVYEIVGRSARFVKPFGLRVDLDRVEAEVRRSVGVDVAVAGDDDHLVAIAPPDRTAAVAVEVAAATGLPSSVIRVCPAAELPRTVNQKIDYAAVLRAGERVSDTDAHAGTDVAGHAVAAAFATVLGRTDIGPDDTFVSLGGDSLSYVECSIRLERALGALPPDWHLTPVAVLEGSQVSPRRFSRIDTTVLLRAIGICLVVSTHMRLWHVPGGAHTLLAVVGYNLARFLAPIDSPTERIRAGLRTAARAAVPAVLWVAGGMALFGSYSLGTLLLVNNYVGPASHADDHWHFWFIEVFVHLVLIATLLLAIPQVRRAERRWQYLAPVAVLIAALALRMEWAQAGDWYNLRYRTHGVAWFFVLGWVIHQSRAWWQRIATTVLCLAVVPGFFRIERRDWMIALALVALVWLREVPFPRSAIRPIGVLASASLWIYISHFTFWPIIDAPLIREVAYPLTIAAGVAVWFVAERLLGLLNTRRQRGFNPPPRPLEARPTRA